MTVEFIPNDIGMWRGFFTFGRIDTGMDNFRSKAFYDRAELIEFLKEHGVRLDDPEFPLKFIKEVNGTNYTHSVVQRSLLGWIKEVLK